MPRPPRRPAPASSHPATHPRLSTLDPQPRSVAPAFVVLAALAASAKYSAIAPAALRRFAAEASLRHRKASAALAAARRALHQACGTLRDDAVRLLDRRLEVLDPSDPGTLRAFCTAALRAHLSTAERLTDLDAVYGRLWEACGPARDVLDVGGGLSAFALPWMGLPPAARYDAVDLDGRAVSLVSRFLDRVGRPGEARCADLLDEPLPSTSGVALCWKLLPTLERQRPGAAVRLLASLHAGTIVVSFPTRSMGGHGKGMASSYAADLRGWCAELGRRPIADWSVGHELFFAIPGGSA